MSSEMTHTPRPLNDGRDTPTQKMDAVAAAAANGAVPAPQLPADAYRIAFQADAYHRALDQIRLPVHESSLINSEDREALHRIVFHVEPLAMRIRNSVGSVTVESSVPLMAPAAGLPDGGAAFAMVGKLAEELFWAEPVYGETQAKALKDIIAIMTVTPGKGAVAVSDSKSNFSARLGAYPCAYDGPLARNAAASETALTLANLDALKFLLREASTFPKKGLDLLTIDDVRGLGGNTAATTIARSAQPTGLSLTMTRGDADSLSSLLRRFKSASWAWEGEQLRIFATDLVCHIDTLAQRFPDASLMVSQVEAKNWRWSVNVSDIARSLARLSVVTPKDPETIHISPPDELCEAAMRLTALGLNGDNIGDDYISAELLGDIDEKGEDRRVSVAMKPLQQALPAGDAGRAELLFHPSALLIRRSCDAGEVMHVVAGRNDDSPKPVRKPKASASNMGDA